MKTLKQLQEGIVASADYKLSKNGKRYKAHRRIIEGSNPYAEILEALGYETENKKRLKQIAANAKNAQTKSSEAKPLEFTEEAEELDEISKGSIEKYMSKAVSDYGHQNFLRRVGKGGDEKEAARKEMSRSKGIERAVKKTTKKNMEEDFELDEARGRPRKMVDREAGESEEHEEHEQDNGMEADQHIHVQLKKAADSDQKPFHVSFKNGKKHPVSQNVAKDILSATERLKPEHRKNVHDEIHQSYDNLVSVHRLIAGK